MLKKDKGITIISLVITVIILVVLGSIATYSGVSTVKESHFYNGVQQMKIMQSKVNEWYEQKKDGNTTEWDKGQKMNEISNLDQCTKAFYSVKQSGNPGKIEKYRYFSKDCITNDLSIDGITYDFMINVENRYVILVDGIERDNKTYYYLGEIDGEQYNVDYTE